MEKYSKTISAGAHTYRYNYETENIEQIGRTVKAGRIGRIIGPTVQEVIKGYFPISPEMFEKCPEYWAMIIEANTKKKSPAF